ncbi:sugar ABC transporter permease [Eubacteriales bacterium OttesenSCG-928-N13]|nr:sugar ABC transporter permease [Eubacteriales bacterium OttesenSCG-928-N13]
MRKNWPGYLLIAPAIIAVLALNIYPLFRGIALSFTNYNLVRPNSPIFNTFAGLSNYQRIFTDEKFLLSIGNTFKWTAVNLVAQLVIAMLLALALNKRLRARSFFRTMSLVPWAVPHSIAAMTFTFLFNANVGIINILAVRFGLLSESISWLGNTGTAFWCVAFVAIWKGIPFQMIFILAALQNISGEIYESAEVDGATRWQQFWRITLPIIKEPLAIATILNLIGIVSCFNTIWLMTEGGPLYSTEIIYTYAYRQGFIVHDLGTASASSMVLFVIMMLISAVYLRLSRGDKEGQA